MRQHGPGNPCQVGGLLPSNGYQKLFLELKFQLFNHLGQSLPRERIGGFQGEPAGLLQLPFQRLTFHSRHAIYPALDDGFVLDEGQPATRE